jgi:uncharacterized protein (DUF302 family)
MLLRTMSRFRLPALLLVALAGPAVARPAAAQGARVTVASQRSFDETIAQFKGTVAQGGMMVMAEVNQGNMLAMTGLKLKATLFLVGSPTVGKQVLEKDHGAGLYLPLRVYLYEDAEGKAFISYDRPTVVLGQLRNADIDMIAGMLDQKLVGLSQMAAR